MAVANDLKKSLVALEQASTLIAVIELSQQKWLVGGLVPGIAREPLKKLEPKAEALLKLLQRWRQEAVQAGRRITRIAVAFEAGPATVFGWRGGCGRAASKPTRSIRRAWRCRASTAG